MGHCQHLGGLHDAAYIENKHYNHVLKSYSMKEGTDMRVFYMKEGTDMRVFYMKEGTDMRVFYMKEGTDMRVSQ